MERKGQLNAVCRASGLWVWLGGQHHWQESVRAAQLGPAANEKCTGSSAGVVKPRTDSSRMAQH